MGSWTLTSGDSGTWNKDTFNLQNMIIGANKHGVETFYGWGVDTDAKDSNMQLIVVCVNCFVLRKLIMK